MMSTSGCHGRDRSRSPVGPQSPPRCIRVGTETSTTVSSGCQGGDRSRSPVGPQSPPQCIRVNEITDSPAGTETSTTVSSGCQGGDRSRSPVGPQSSPKRSRISENIDSLVGTVTKSTTVASSVGPHGSTPCLLTSYSLQQPRGLQSLSDPFPHSPVQSPHYQLHTPPMSHALSPCHSDHSVSPSWQSSDDPVDMQSARPVISAFLNRFNIKDKVRW